MSVLPFASPVLGHERTTPAVLLEIAQAISSIQRTDHRYCAASWKLRVSRSRSDTQHPKSESLGTGERVESSVADTGEGIPDEELPHIFDKFYQVQRGIQAKAKGTGLGLSIATSLVELQGGCIRVASQVGQGSMFTFALPRRPMAEFHEAETLDGAESIL